MKRQNIILLLLTGLFLTVCCHKEKEDYREKWEGDYIGEYIHSFVTTGVYNKDTIRDAIFNVSILNDSGLHITYGGTQWEVKIYSNGYYEQYDDQTGHFHCNGNIRGDSIILSSSYKSPGAITRQDFNGKKILK